MTAPGERVTRAEYDYAVKCIGQPIYADIVLGVLRRLLDERDALQRELDDTRHALYAEADALDALRESQTRGESGG